MGQKLVPELLFMMPLLSALSLFLWHTPTLARRGAAAAFFTLIFVLSIIGFSGALSGEIQVTLAGGWMAPFGIVLVYDMLSASLLLAANLVFLATALYSFGEEKIESEKLTKLPLLFFLQAGVTLTLLTGDFFNLFVAVEVMLVSSYALMTLTADLKELPRAFSYIILSMTASFLFLVLAGSIYGYTGHLNMAAIAESLQGKGNEPFVVSIALIALVIFGLKSGVFPLYFWLPDSYPILPPSLAALFGGVLTKVGVYVLIRLFVTVLPHDLGSVYPIIAILSGLTMLLGVIGAIGKQTVKGVLSYHILSQTGYMIFALSLFTPAAIGAGLYFIIHNILVKSSLFLLGGFGERVAKSDELGRMGGLWTLFPFGGLLFFIQAMSLAGIPPLSGFWGKFLILSEGLKGESWILVGIGALTSFFTLFSMIKIWTMAYMGKPAQEKSASFSGLIASSCLLVAGSLIFALALEPSTNWTKEAAEQAYQTGRYVSSVYGAIGKGDAR